MWSEDGKLSWPSSNISSTYLQELGLELLDFKQYEKSLKEKFIELNLLNCLKTWFNMPCISSQDYNKGKEEDDNSSKDWQLDN